MIVALTPKELRIIIKALESPSVTDKETSRLYYRLKELAK